MQSVNVQGNDVFCPIDGCSMRYQRSVKDQIEQDSQGKNILVTKKIFICPKCESLIAFSFRQDGQPGELKQLLDAEKKVGKIFKSELH